MVMKKWIDKHKMEVMKKTRPYPKKNPSQPLKNHQLSTLNNYKVNFNYLL